MGSLRDDRDDTDNDDMEHDSADSDKSSSSSDSSDSDSDDSSELDGEECEKRRNELLDTISELERQFGLLREQLYKERKSQIKRKFEELQEGTAQEYRQPLQELQDNMNIRLEVANVLRQLRLENINNSYDAEEQAAKQNFENEKVLLYDSMKEELEDKIRRLEEEGSADMTVDWPTDRSAKVSKHSSKISSKKGFRSLEHSSRRKPVTVSGPFIVYMLTEEEIHEDWSVIRKALAKRNSERMYT